MRRRAVVVILFALAGCRTTRPPNAEPLSPLTSTSPSEAERQLAARRSQFRGERSLIRLRLPQISARGQLQVDADGRTLITVYSPIGTTVARLYVDGDDVVFLNDLQNTAWRGKASQLIGTLGMFGNARLPFLLIGLPAAGVHNVTYAPTGMQTAPLADVMVTYDPPVYPPKRVAVDRGAQHVEIEHLESFVDPQPLKPLEIPRDYQCCVLPQM